MQSYSYCTSEARSGRGGIGIPYSASTTTNGIQDYQAAEIGQTLTGPGYDNTASLPSHFGDAFTGNDTPYYGPYHDTSPEGYQRMDFSLNSYSNIGIQFDLDRTQGFERNLLMDPVFSQDLPTNSYNNSNVTVADQIYSENEFLPFEQNVYADGVVSPTVLNARACANSSYRDASIPAMHTGRAAMPTNATTCIASTSKGFSTDPATLSNYSPNTASVETSHPNGSSDFSNPCYNAAPRATGTPNSPHRPTASLDYMRNGTSSDIIPVAEASSNPFSTFHQPIQPTSPSPAPTKIFKPNQLQAINHSGYNKPLDPTALVKSPHNALTSVTKPKPHYGVSKCPWKGCLKVRRGKDHRTNMRTHVRDAHEKPAPPTCEICGKIYAKNGSLKRHLQQSNHPIDIEKVVCTVRKTRADGTVYTTYQEVHDYVNMRKMKRV